MTRSFSFWRRLVAAIPVLLSCFVGQVAAADPMASDWAVDKRSAVRLVADSVSPTAFRLGLQFRLQPGWKTYWRSPGDAGFPATADWSGSQNIDIGALEWPAPRRFSLQGFETFGYENQLVLLAPARAAQAGQPVHLDAELSYLVCREVCLPVAAHLQLDVVAGTRARPWRDLLDQWQAQLPAEVAPGVAGEGITLLGVVAEGSGHDGYIDLDLTATPPLGHPDVMIEGVDIGVSPAPDLRLDPNGQTVLHLLPPGGGDLGRLVGHSVTITLVDPPRAITVATRIAAPLSAPSASSGLGVSILLTALLGGFILNFMPCVLPVLSIKVLAVIAKADSAASHWRAGFLATAAGVVTAFLTLAFLLALARSAGLAIGWGVQFQQPVFLSALAAVTLGFAANLFGFFEIAVPEMVTERISTHAPSRPGQASLAGSFLTGIFATILATPCSAPFLGTAIGFGLAGSNLDILAIFLCLGLGLASPYVVLAIMPWLGRFLPRPGAWMLTLRRLLGLPLLATSLWLVWVVAGEAGIKAALAVGGVGLLGLICLSRGPGLRRLAVVLLLAMPGLALIWPTANPRAQHAEGIWQPFAPDRISAEVAAGHSVFVDVTADWCLTCHVNERVVLDAQPVVGRLSRPGLVAMRADWTRPDPRIANFLRRFHRYGIPLYVVFGPAAPQGLALPEVITPGLVTETLDQASLHPGN